MKWFFIILSILAVNFEAFTQEKTVGVLHNSADALNGYTLIMPTSSRNTYLIDNCGDVVNTWQSDYIPGMVAYLLEDGRLLRACRIPGELSSGGAGGRVEIYSWDDELLWSFELADATQHLHHDIAYMPNGNILMIAWDKRSNQEIIDAGRDPNSIGANGVWYEKILEIKPIGTDSFEIVWEWYLFDHLVQDYDSTKNNYGPIRNFPHRMDINYRNFFGTTPGPSDWFHLNAINYNQALDQILLSSRSTSEIYIIDHSTTTEEAATSTGGNSGMGGDFLFRWGNPQVYKRGTPLDQRLFGQHDAQWIKEGTNDQGKILVFNNGIGRSGKDYSSIEIINPPLAGYNYTLVEDEAFDPEESYWTFNGEGQTEFFSSRISGTTRLDNGNTLICSGNEGRIFEIDSTGKLVWDFINPINQFGATSQGTAPGSNDMFRAYRYPKDYGAFKDRILFAGFPIESDPWPSDCMIFDNTVNTLEYDFTTSFVVYPNPASDLINFDNQSSRDMEVQITDMYGNMQTQFRILSNQMRTQEITHWQSGVYFVRLNNGYTIKLLVVH